MAQPSENPTFEVKIMAGITFEQLDERMNRIHASLKEKQDNGLIESNMALKAQIMDLTLSDYFENQRSTLESADEKELAKYWRNNSPVARELDLDVPSQGQPTKDYGVEMRTFEARMKQIANRLVSNLEEEDISLLSSICRSPSKNDTYGTVEALIQHCITDKAINRTKAHFDNGLTWGEDGNPIYNMPQKEDA